MQPFQVLKPKFRILIPNRKPLAWRAEMRTWPERWRDHWGRLANRFEDGGLDWMAAEQHAAEETRKDMKAKRIPQEILKEIKPSQQDVKLRGQVWIWTIKGKIERAKGGVWPPENAVAYCVLGGTEWVDIPENERRVKEKKNEHVR